MFPIPRAMRSRRIAAVSLLAFAGALATIGAPCAVAADAGSTPGVVWLTCETSGKDQTNIRLPLKWLAAVERQQKDRSIKIEDVRLNCGELWDNYKDMPVGETHQIRKDVDKDGEPYVLRVVSVPFARDRALGKVHIVSRDKKGEKTDIAFPLDIPKLVESIVSLFTGFFGGDAARIDVGGITIAGPADLKKLADYGRFVFLESVDADSSTVRITIE